MKTFVTSSNIITPELAKSFIFWCRLPSDDIWDYGMFIMSFWTNLISKKSCSNQSSGILSETQVKLEFFRSLWNLKNEQRTTSLQLDSKFSNSLRLKSNHFSEKFSIELCFEKTLWLDSDSTSNFENTFDWSQLEQLVKTWFQIYSVSETTIELKLTSKYNYFQTLLGIKILIQLRNKSSLKLVLETNRVS